MSKRTSLDALLMAAVRIIVLGFSLITTMILSKTLPLVDYGTYSTGNLIINTATSLSALGLLDAINYYYNGMKSNRMNYINTVFCLVCSLGLIAAVIILLFQNSFTAYFHNPKLAAIYCYIAFRPLLSNLTLGCNNLQISIGKARFVTLRNFLISLGKLLIVLLVSLTTRNVDTIFLCLVALEAATVLLNCTLLEKNGVHIRIHKSDFSLLPEIIKFCLPMGIYIQASSLAQSLDIFVIGRFEATAQLAIYSNCAARLPIDFIPVAFLTVLMPTITSYIHTQNLTGGTRLIRNYVKLAYITTWAFGTACIALAPQAIDFLYGSKYLDGIWVFILYVIADMLRFANISIFLSAKGDTKTLMWLSLGMLVANLLLNYLFYLILGFIGPAIATVMVMSISTLFLLKKSAAVFHCSFFALFDWTHLAKQLGLCLICGTGTYFLRVYFEDLGLHPYIILFVCGFLCAVSILAANYKNLRLALTQLNQDGHSA
jgi:O-antigen/teichoic acid export membrane protein